MDHGMTSRYGPWAMARDASGTSWQPEAAGHGGIHSGAGATAIPAAVWSSSA